MVMVASQSGSSWTSIDSEFVSHSCVLRDAFVAVCSVIYDLSDDKFDRVMNLHSHCVPDWFALSRVVVIS